MGWPRQSSLRRLSGATVFAPRYRRGLYWWAGTRALLLLWSLNAVPYFSRGAVLGDVVTYHNWSNIMLHGSFPSSDPEWQYPPGAALVMLMPKALAFTGIGYVNQFFIFALLADFAVFALLVGQAEAIARRSPAPGGAEGAPHLAGVWAWVLGGFALGPIMFMRYDVMVTAVAVAGMVYAVRAGPRRGGERAERLTWRARGALTGLGAIVKVWPVVLLLGAPPGLRGRRTLVWSAAVAAGVSAVLSLFMSGALSFLSQQGGRGIEVESVLASPFMIAAWFGYPAQTTHQFGSFQVSGPGTALVGAAAIFVTLLGFGAVLWWRLRRMRPESWTPALMCDIGFTTLLIMVVTSRVLSPQYMIWLIGMAAVCLAEGGSGRRGTLMVKPAAIVLCCTLVSQVEFPLLFGQVMHHGFWGTALVAARNAALVTATVLAGRALWRSTAAVDRLQTASVALGTESAGEAEHATAREVPGARTATAPDPESAVRGDEPATASTPEPSLTGSMPPAGGTVNR